MQMQRRNYGVVGVADASADSPALSIPAWPGRHMCLVQPPGDPLAYAPVGFGRTLSFLITIALLRSRGEAQTMMAATGPGFSVAIVMTLIGRFN